MLFHTVSMTILVNTVIVEV